MKNMKEILEKISAEHPYKVSGDWDSYSQYNEAWQDCIARIEQEMDLMQQENRFEFNFSGVKAFDCQCGRRYVNTDGWIPVEERLPEEKTNPVTQDFYEYQVTAKFQDIEDIRHYKFGNGHWWHGPGLVDQYVVAWLPRPDPYRKEG